MTYLLNTVYLLLLIAVSPILLYRSVVHGKYRDGWSEKLLGRLPRRDSNRPCLWFHAVSVGEVLQLQTVLDELGPHVPDHDFVITTTTVTGLGVAREKFCGARYHVCYFPLDFSWAVNRALDMIQPQLVVLVELELWPNFIRSVSRRDVPLALINGRISEKSFRGYRRIRFLMQKLLQHFETLAVQNEAYGERLIALGAPADRVIVTGSIKFDGARSDRDNSQTAELRKSFGLETSDRIFVAGSTQAPEEEYAIESWSALRESFPDLRLILVPRHKERFEEVAELVKRYNLPLLRRSQTTSEQGTSAPFIHDRPVILLDTLGELGACWGLADIAFVGGSLTQRGGQNMIEPAAYGAAVLFGPNTWNFRDVVELLLQGEAARVVANREELTNTIAELLKAPTAAASQGRIAQQLVLAQQGATRKTCELIVRSIEDGRRPSSRAA